MAGSQRVPDQDGDRPPPPPSPLRSRSSAGTRTFPEFSAAGGGFISDPTSYKYGLVSTQCDRGHQLRLQDGRRAGLWRGRKAFPRQRSHTENTVSLQILFRNPSL